MFKRACIVCLKDIVYKGKLTFDMSVTRTDEPWCKSCATKKTHADGKLKHREEKLSSSMKKVWANEKVRQQYLKVFRDPVNVKRVSDIRKRMWADPDSAYNTQGYRDLKRKQGLEQWGSKETLSMTRERNKSPDSSRKSHDWSRSVKERDKFTCQECGSNERLHSHHIKERRHEPELAYDVSNGLTLCIHCHSNYHPWTKKLWGLE